MRIVCIIQARMGSTRLPGKVLLDVAGQSMLARVVARVRESRLLAETIVATTVAPQDDVLADACGASGVSLHRGSEQDVLDRYHQAAAAFGAEGVVRVTSDCPLIDARVIDQVVTRFLEAGADYASNVQRRTFPRGLDVEVFSAAALDLAWREARTSRQREHVTPYFYETVGLFRLASLEAEADYSAHRWTVDTPEDLQLVRSIYDRMAGERFGWRDVLNLLQREPELAKINRHVVQKS